MKYITYIISLIFVLAIIGCGKPKESKTEVPEVTAETIEEATGAVEEGMESAVEAVEEAVDEVTE